MTDTTSIVTAVDALPADSITVKVLNALDFVVPGEWRNVVGFDKTAQDVLGTLEPNRAGQIRMRLAAWVALDGLVPLGPDFARKALQIVNGLKPSHLEQSATFLRLRELIPGAPNALNQLRFVQDGLNTVQGWTSGFIADHGLTPQKVYGSINRFIDVSDNALDYVGAFLDATTDYMAHTGTQSVAR